MSFRLALTACLLALGLATVLQGTSVLSGEIDYYSDATLQNWSGYLIKSCSGQTWRAGTATDYWTFYA